MEPWLSRQARERPDAPALDGLTFAELHARAAARPVAGAVAVDAGDLVGLHACWLHGAAAVPAAPHLPAVAEAPAGTALVVFTSGTTAEPRPVNLSYAALDAHARAVAAALDLGPGVRWLCPLPLTHVGGLMVLVRAVALGFEALVGRERLLERLMAGEATFVSLVPTQLARLLDAGLAAPPGLRAVVLGGAPASPALRERARCAGVPVVESYGMTETASMVALDGRPLPGVRIALAPDGEILVEAPAVSGVLRTGDLGRFGAGGRLEVVGRKGDTIITGGENVAPAAVEAVLLAHPDVADAAVFGRPHPDWGEAVVAAVVPRPGAAVDAERLRAFCRERLAPFQVPKAFEAAEVLPRTPSGKLLRRRLR